MPRDLHPSPGLVKFSLRCVPFPCSALEAKREHLMAADTPGDHLEIGGLGFGLKVHVTGTEPGVDVHFECQRVCALLLMP